ncbi:MAG: alkaline phosphatase family protein [Reichenbachiella sp.]|uniref:alkaline phosphatase family protein n=1 Tax=Reichenbachiella sp. TaxID=2184521 RepID=UPI0032642DC5
MIDIELKHHSLYILILLLFLQSCVPDSATEQKVIVVHARGLSHSNLMNYLEISDQEGFLQRARSDGKLQKLEPITNAVTISNIASFETGVFPDQHGIVGHNFGRYENQSITVRSGFETRFEQAAFWEKADKNGMRVLNVGALTLHGKYETHENVDCLAQGENRAEGRFVYLVPSLVKKDSLINYTETGEESIGFLSSATQKFKVYKRPSERRTLYVESDSGVLNRIQKSEWLEWVNKSSSGKEAFRLKWTESQSDTITFYVRGSFVNRGYPSSFLAEVDQAVGASKGWPNIVGYAIGEITASTLIEEINDELDYVMDVFDYVANRETYDLIMVDYPLMDRYGHAFWNTIMSTNELRDELELAYDRMNDDFDQIKEFADVNDYTLIIASGHGFSPIQKAVNLEHLLTQNEIITDVEQIGWEAKGIAGKVSSHIYINPQLTTNDKTDILAKLIAVFENCTDPNSGMPVVDQIYSKDELGKIGMDHQNSGDLFVILKPGYIFKRNGKANDPLFSQPFFKGDHGYGLDHEDAYGMIISDRPCVSCQTTDISNLVLTHLGLESSE